MPQLTGRCACNAVTWSAPGPVLWAGHCHCESCRRASSAPMTSFFGVARDSVTWTGAMTSRWSSPADERGHCPACGSQMFIRCSRWPEETHLYAATLDDAAMFIPEAHYHWAERLDWFEIRDGLPKHQGSADA